MARLAKNKNKKFRQYLTLANLTKSSFPFLVQWVWRDEAK